MMVINKSASVTSKNEILITAGCQTVWSTLTNINAWTSWNTKISNVRWNGDLKPATAFIWKTDGFKIRSTLHTVDPFKHFDWSGTAVGTYAIHNWTLTETEGQTSIIVEESMEGILPSLFKRPFKKNLEKGLDRWLDLLKHECERL